jgi:hypothetical protein
MKLLKLTLCRRTYHLLLAWQPLTWLYLVKRWLGTDTHTRTAMHTPLHMRIALLAQIYTIRQTCINAEVV